MKKLIINLFFLTLLLNISGQSLYLTFTAVDYESYVQLDSIKIMNRTQGGETMIYWPDTTLIIEINEGDLLLFVGYATFSTVNVQEVNKKISSFDVKQNYPNPMRNQSEIAMFIPQYGQLQVIIFDMQGRNVFNSCQQIDEGYHAFRFYPGSSNFYFLTAYLNGMSSSIKMIALGQKDTKHCKLEYIGSITGETALKKSFYVNDFMVQQSGILDDPDESQTYTFQFAYNLPCPGIPTIEYEDQTYNTVQIFSQCWLKENLNVGKMIAGAEEMTNNDTVEKYCFNNNPDSCTKYGGLYQWWEMMQYTTQQATQGICPPGWHIPTDEEWKLLEGTVDSYYEIGDPVWDSYFEFRGYDAGDNIKTTSGWYYGGNGTDLYGFSGLPGGYRFRYNFINYFQNIGDFGIWSTSTAIDDSYAWGRDVDKGSSGIYRSSYIGGKWNGLSVRCLRNY